MYNQKLEFQIIWNVMWMCFSVLSLSPCVVTSHQCEVCPSHPHLWCAPALCLERSGSGQSPMSPVWDVSRLTLGPQRSSASWMKGVCFWVPVLITRYGVILAMPATDFWDQFIVFFAHNWFFNPIYITLPQRSKIAGAWCTKCYIWLALFSSIGIFCLSRKCHCRYFFKYWL